MPSKISFRLKSYVIKSAATLNVLEVVLGNWNLPVSPTIPANSNRAAASDNFQSATSLPSSYSS